MTTKNAKTMTPDEWKKARRELELQHALTQHRQREAAALKELERKYPKSEGTKK